MLLPCVALVLLTGIVAGVMYSRRIAEMRARRISPQSIALSRQAAERLEDTRGADNFRNLFELPVLFYALCFGVIALGVVSTFYVVAAWLFVALRAAHSFVQLGGNHVMTRFRVFTLGMLVLYATWGVLAWDTIARL
jgi:hypothetical protein